MWSYMKCEESHAQIPGATCSGLCRLGCKMLLSTFSQTTNASLSTSTEVQLLEANLICLHLLLPQVWLTKWNSVFHMRLHSLGSAISRQTTLISFLVNMFVLPQFHACVCSLCGCVHVCRQVPALSRSTFQIPLSCSHRHL